MSAVFFSREAPVRMGRFDVHKREGMTIVDHTVAVLDYHKEALASLDMAGE